MEFALVEEQMREIDALIEQGRTNLNWNSTGIYAIMYSFCLIPAVEHIFLCLVSISILVMYKHLKRDLLIFIRLCCYIIMFSYDVFSCKFDLRTQFMQIPDCRIFHLIYIMYVVLNLVGKRNE